MFQRLPCPPKLHVTHLKRFLRSGSGETKASCHEDINGFWKS